MSSASDHSDTVLVIEVRELLKVYPGPPDVHALGPVNLTVQRGDYLAIRGRSGSGKTTLLNMLGLLDVPTGGDYFLGGIDTKTLDENQRTALRGRRVGFVFQDFQLLESYSVTENVALGQLYTGTPASERQERARRALREVGLEHRAEAVPSMLSGGERQRVAIARALIGDPDVLLCDEPTGNLDSENSARILDLIGQMHDQGATVVMITHDQTTADRAQYSLTITDGVLHDAGGDHA